MKNQVILTNHVGADRSRSWGKFSYCPEFGSFTSIPLVDAFSRAWRLFRLRKNYQVVVLGGGAWYDQFYLLLQRLWPRHKRPVVKIDCLWYRSAPFSHFFRKILFRWLDAVVACYVVWSRREITDYASAFDLPESKFFFIPYHTTNVESFAPRNRGYIFSGGNFARDYKTLAEAVKGLDVQLVIACSNPEVRADLELPANVSLVAVDHGEFMRLMAESGINVVSLDVSLLHSGGQQTFLNAMAMGKAVIVTDPQGAADYIEDGVDGLLVPGKDPRQLRAALQRLLNNPEFAAQLGAKAQKKAQDMDTENSLAAIARVALNLRRKAYAL